jgi:hypothetical protein
MTVHSGHCKFKIKFALFVKMTKANKKQLKGAFGDWISDTLQGTPLGGVSMARVNA